MNSVMGNFVFLIVTALSFLTLGCEDEELSVRSPINKNWRPVIPRFSEFKINDRLGLNRFLIEVFGIPGGNRELLGRVYFPPESLVRVRFSGDHLTLKLEQSPYLEGLDYVLGVDQEGKRLLRILRIETKVPNKVQELEFYIIHRNMVMLRHLLDRFEVEVSCQRSECKRWPMYGLEGMLPEDSKKILESDPEIKSSLEKLEMEPDAFTHVLQFLVPQGGFTRTERLALYGIWEKVASPYTSRFNFQPGSRSQKMFRAKEKKVEAEFRQIDELFADPIDRSRHDRVVR